MCKEPTFEQLEAMYELNEGDKVLLINGDIVEFVRAKQKKFIGIMDNKNYNIPIAMYKETKEKVDIHKKKEENQSLINQLKKDDWFYINKNGNALLFKFVEIKANKIIGVNPIGDTTTRIDMSFEIGLVK